MKSFIRLRIFLSFLVLHYPEDTNTTIITPDEKRNGPLFNTVKKKNPQANVKDTIEHLQVHLPKQDTGFPTALNSGHLLRNNREGINCTNSNCPLRDTNRLVQIHKAKAQRVRHKRQKSSFLVKAMGVLDDSSPLKFARQNVYRQKKKNNPRPISSKSASNFTVWKRPNKQNRKNARMHGPAKFPIGGGKQHQWMQHHQGLGNILPLLSDQRHGPVANPAPIERFQQGAIHLMLRPGKGPAKFKLLQSDPEKKQFDIQGGNHNFGDIHFAGPHLGGTPWNGDVMEPSSMANIGGEHIPSQIPIHVTSPTVIHHTPFPLDSPFHSNGPVSGPLDLAPSTPMHHFSFPSSAFPVPIHFHHTPVQRVPFAVPVPLPPKVEHVAYPIRVPVPGPPRLHPFLIPVQVPSPPRIERIPFPVPVRMRPQIQHIPFPVPVPVPSHPQIRHIPYPVAVPVKQPPQIQKFFYPVQVPQPMQIHHVPFPVYIHSPPQIKRIPVPVPSPPKSVPVPVPGPTRIVINKVPFPVIVPRIQKVTALNY